MRLLLKSTIIIIAIALLAFGLILYFTWTSNVKTLRTQTEEKLKNLAFDAMDKIDHDLFERMSDLRIIANDPVITSRDSTPEEITKRLLLYRNIYKTYASISFFDLNRVRIANTSGLGIGQKTSAFKNWDTVMQGNPSIASDVDISKIIDIPVIFCATLIREKNEKPLGIVLASIPVNKLYETLGDSPIHLREEGGIRIDIVNKAGLLIYSNYNRKGVLNDNLSELEGLKEISENNATSFITKHRHIAGEDTIAIFCKEQGYLDFKGNGWVLIIHIPTRIIFAPIVALRTKLVIVMFASVILAIAMALILSLRLSKPINSLRNAVIDFGKGKPIGDIKIKSHDEIEELGDAFAQMIIDLKKTTTSVKNLEKEIEERKRLESHLEESRKQIEYILGATNTGLDIIDSDYNMVYINPEWQKIYGEYKGKKCYEYFMDRKEVCPHCGVTEAFKTKMKVVTEEVLVKEGNRPVQITTIPYQDLEGHWLVAEVNIDISERKKTEEAVYNLQQKYKAILDNSFQFIGLMTLDGILVEANKAALTFAGIDAEKVMGKPFWEGPWWSHSPTLRQKLQEGIKAAAAGEFVRFEATHPDKDGKLFYIDFSLTPVKDKNGTIIYIIPEGRDITERKRDEMELYAYRNQLEGLVAERTQEVKNSEKRFSTIFNDSRDGLILAAPETKRFMMCNKSICEMLGYTEEEIINMGLADIHPESDIQHVKEIFERLAKGEIKTAGNIPMLRKDGSIFYADINASIISLNEKGYLLGSFRDITQRKNVEDKILKLSSLKKDLIGSGGLNDKLKTVTDGIVDIFKADFARAWLLKPGDLCETDCVHASVKNGPHVCLHRGNCLHLIASSGRYTHINGNHGRVPMGCYKIGRIATGEYDDFVTNNAANDPKVHDHEWARSLGLVSFAGYRLVSKENEPIGVIALFAKHPIDSNDEALLKDLASTVSQMIMTESAKEALAESEANYRSIFETANDGIIIRDIETYRVVDINRRACEMYLRTSSEMIGSELRLMVYDDPSYNYEKLKAYMDKAASGEPQLFEWLAQDRAGRSFWVEANVRRSVTGGRYHIMSILRDITERKRVSDIKDNFTNMVSHELRTPLATIKESISLVAEGDVGPVTKKQNEMFAIVKRNVDRLARLINQVLDLQKFEAGAMRMDLKENDINKVVDESYRTMLSVAGKKGLRILLKLGTDLPLVKFDHDKISEVLINLIDNAVRHTETGEITITTGLDDTYLKVSVQDTGHGIKEEDMPKLFQRFSQLERKAGGTGLGLAISKEIIESHLGSIWAESGPGKGTTFYFTLPTER